MAVDPREIQRPLKPKGSEQLTFAADLGIQADNWRDHWWGMPSFEMGDATPSHRITVNFLTMEDYQAFQQALGIRLTPRSDSMWFPEQSRTNGEYSWCGDPVVPRYPIYIPSKGRWDNQTTGRLLESVGITDYRFCIEETEAEQYIKAVGENHVLVMPFHDLGQGSIPARNWLWEHAKASGARRHWCLDDNILSFYRTTMNRRIGVRTGAVLAAIEDWADRYENVALAGPHHKGFVPDRSDSLTPVLLNSRIYSCILIDTNLPHRWRGRYNEDTDLSLRVLKDGYCTALFRALMMEKAGTHSGGCGNGSGGKGMKGGNTDHVYNTGDHRLAFAKSLADQHPDVVKVVWKFNRWHHEVDYKPFAGNRLKLRPGVVPTRAVNEYGMRLEKAANDNQEQSTTRGATSGENRR